MTTREGIPKCVDCASDLWLIRGEGEVITLGWTEIGAWTKEVYGIAECLIDDCWIIGAWFIIAGWFTWTSCYWIIGYWM